MGWLRSFLALAAAASARNSSVEDGHVRVDGEPFFVIGSYARGLDDDGWARHVDAGFNTVLTYTNGNAELAYDVGAASINGTTRFLDDAAARGVKVVLSLKDFYSDTAPNGTDVDALVEDVVKAFLGHDALLGWYVVDEVKDPPCPPSRDLQQAAARAKAVVALDPSHVTYALLDTMLATPFSERPADFANLSVVLGTDPYVYVNETTPNDLSDQRRDVELLSEGLAGLGGAAAGLPVSQMAMYPCWDCPPAHCVCEYNGETYVSEFPAAGPLEAMAFVAATRSQGSGLLFYSYYRLLGYPSSTPLPADALEDRLSSMRRVGSKLRDAAPTLLTTRRDDLLNVTSASPDVALSYYETGPDTFVLFAVNGRNALGAFDVVASNLSVALSDVEPWAVVRVDVDAGGARVRRVALDSESRRVVH